MAQTDNDRKRRITSKGRKSWITRENILMAAGMILIVATFITAEEGRPFHYEFLILAGGMMGLGIAQWGDRRNGK